MNDFQAGDVLQVTVGRHNLYVNEKDYSRVSCLTPGELVMVLGPSTYIEHEFWVLTKHGAGVMCLDALATFRKIGEET